VQCDSGLFCVQLRSGEKLCSSCDQSRLDRLTAPVDDFCKDSRWKPESSPEFKDATASDGRVLVDVYDMLLDNAKKCKAARQDREGTCWAGGNPTHIEKINEATRSIDFVAGQKTQAISALRVYYGSRSDYSSYLSTFNSKCDLNFPNMNQKIDAMSREKDINCSDLEKYGNDSERCFNAAKDLRRYGFADSSSKFPSDYAKSYDTAEKTMNKAREVFKTLKDKSLCK
jgi:hypothetical protein